MFRKPPIPDALRGETGFLVALLVVGVVVTTTLLLAVR